jgi:hypothetical protein
MDAAVIVHRDDPTLRVVSAGGLLLVHIRQRYTHEEGVVVHAAQEYMRSSVGRHAVYVIVSDIRTELSEHARSLSRRTTAEFADSVVCVANVIEPRGIIGATVRCVMAGVRAINKPPYPVRDFASTRSAAMWMAPLLREADIPLPIALPIGGEAEALLEWVERARASERRDGEQPSTGS